MVTVDGFYVLDDYGQHISWRMARSRSPATAVLPSMARRRPCWVLAEFDDPAAELTRDGNNTFAASGQPNGENTT